MRIAVSFRGSCQLSWLGLGCMSRNRRISYLMFAANDVADLAVAVCKIRDVCCLPASALQPSSSNSLGLSAPEEASSSNVRAPGTV